MPVSSTFSIDVERIALAHEFTLDSSRRCEYPNGRGTYGLVYVLEGEAEYRFFGGGRVRARRGDCLFISDASAYVIETEEPFLHDTVNFEIHAESSSLGVLDAPYCLLRGEHTEQLERIFRRLVTLWSARRTGYEMQAVGVLYELLSRFYLAYTEKTGDTDARLTRAREYIEQHFAEAIGLKELAYLSNMSVTNFRREWARHYALPPMQYRDSVRIAYAKEYLSSGYYSVTEVAHRCGFEDVSYFVRFFGKKVGVTPRAFCALQRE